ncbi:bifunctional metallophosphatase/5'-nucleotidase [Aliidiomarina quisquiliarum]|uniref:bifunctional metallophosphatase/5'-nucleotidase n=1 Tax=Aliidiomarina quisquiliarum TaxID=2938947 RepID=UPI00208DFE12|nr:bifunctional metallophosphatase/5'-nucleotidase [Aliidiomarina quisquiliarum]MCO4321043.1 bifunctional metallophosphatase/5'-nucleotidase [Aliidiomarina quisquiliarum]
MKHLQPWGPIKTTAITSLILFSGLMTGCADLAKPNQQQRAAAPFELYIAHVNDTHSAFDPIRSAFTAQADNTTLKVHTEFGGHPRLLSQIKQHRVVAAEQGYNLLFLHGGDAWQGTGYFILNEGRMNADILNRFGLDAMALGNHEFDLNNQLLNEFIGSVHFPVLAANVDTSADQHLREQTNLRPYVLFAFDQQGNKTKVASLNQLPKNQQVVAVFGVVLDDMPNIAPNTGDVRFLDMVTSAQHTVNTLEAAGVQNIVAVTHIGLGLDQRLASEVNGIDIIVGGHSHTLLGDFTELDWGNQGPYAEQITNPNGSTRTCIVQAGEYAQAMGLVRVVFDTKGKLAECSGTNTLLIDQQFYSQATQLASERFSEPTQAQVAQFVRQQINIAMVAEEPNLRQHINKHYKPELEASFGEVIGFVPQNIMHARRPGSNNSDKHGSQLAPLVAYAQYRWFMRPEVQQVTGRVPDFALVGAGGIRTAINQGELREGNISLEMLPFASHLAVVSLTGAQVKALLEDTIRQTLVPNAHDGKFPYGGNLRYSFNEAVGLGEVTQLEVNRGSLYDPQWQPLQPEATYNVVTSSYSAAGNDGWTNLYEAQQHGSDRLDVVLVNGKPQVYEVAKVRQTADGKLHTLYKQQGPECAKKETDCAVDAQSVIRFLQEEHQSLLALPYPVVTLNRL